MFTILSTASTVIYAHDLGGSSSTAPVAPTLSPSICIADPGKCALGSTGAADWIGIGSLAGVVVPICWLVGEAVGGLMGPAILKRFVCIVDAGGVDPEDSSSADSPYA